MAIVPITNLKTKFETGDRPTQQDFVDLIDTTAFHADSLGGDSNNNVTINGIESATVFDTIDTNIWRTVKYLVQLSHAGSTSYRSTELNLIFDGTNQNITEYGSDKHTNSDVGTISASLNSGTISMTVTPVLSPMTIRYYRTGLKA